MKGKETVLVAGATGYLGRFVVQEFKRRGYWVRVLARNPEKLHASGPFLEPAIYHLADDVFVGEVTEAKTLQGLCDDIDIVFSSIGITRQRDGVSFMDVDYRGNKNILDAAIESNVKKFVFVSVFKADRIAELVEAREMFVKDLKQSGLAYDIIRPTGYFSDMSEYLKMAKSGTVFLLGSGKCKINPIHGNDLARVCVDCAEDIHKHGETNVGGPASYSHEEIASLAFEVLSKKKRIVRIPLRLVKLVMNCLRPFNQHTFQITRFFTIVTSNDFVAPQTGSYSLRRYFEEYVRQC